MQLGDTPPELIAWLKQLAYSTFAAFGGMMGYLMRTMDKKQPLSFVRAVVEALGAGFVGYIVLQLCSAMRLSPEWTGVVVGVLGWLGANASIRLLERVVIKKLGLDNSTTEQDNEHTSTDNVVCPEHGVDQKEPKADD